MTPAPKCLEQSRAAIDDSSARRMTRTLIRATCHREESACLDSQAIGHSSAKMDLISWASQNKYKLKVTSSEKVMAVEAHQPSLIKLLLMEKLEKPWWCPFHTTVEIVLGKQAWSLSGETIWPLWESGPKITVLSTVNSKWTKWIIRPEWWIHMKSTWCGRKRKPHKRKYRSTKSSSCRSKFRILKPNKTNSVTKWSGKSLPKKEGWTETRNWKKK